MLKRIFFSVVIVLLTVMIGYGLGAGVGWQIVLLLIPMIFLGVVFQSIIYSDSKIEELVKRRQEILKNM